MDVEEAKKSKGIKTNKQTNTQRALLFSSFIFDFLAFILHEKKISRLFSS